MSCRYRFLREADRKANKENYPALNYPELYLLEGGYKAFHEQQKVRGVFLLSFRCHPMP